MKRPVIVTGPPGSGKSTASEVIAHRLGYQIVNVGDVLLAELFQHGIRVERRIEIGKHFLRHAGTVRYLWLVEQVTQEGTVIDGLRIACALDRLRYIHPELVHVHRLGRPTGMDTPNGQADNYAQDVDQFCSVADMRVGWAESRGELERQLGQRFGESGLGG